MASPPWRNAVNLSHLVVQKVVGPADIVIDATCGNGHDTLFLAGLVPRGRVLGFDLSPQAIMATSRRLEQEGLRQRVDLFQEDFRLLRFYVTDPVQAIMFNLGYLPGGDRQTCTTAEASSEAVRQAAPLLQPGGIMTVVCYPGHEGGREEVKEVMKATAQLEQKEFEVLTLNFINQTNDPPLLVVVHRLGGGVRG